MNDYLLLMFNDLPPGAQEDGEAWGPYLGRLHQSGRFGGGSSIGGGVRLGQDGRSLPLVPGLTGFLRVQATSLDDARQWLVGNPVYEAGGTVEIRELLRDDT